MWARIQNTGWETETHDGALGAAVGATGGEPGEDSDHRPRDLRPPWLEASELKRGAFLVEGGER
jgi:hypothetical protein